MGETGRVKLQRSMTAVCRNVGLHPSRRYCGWTGATLLTECLERTDALPALGYECLQAQ